MDDIDVTDASSFTENLLSNCFVRRRRGAAGVENALTKFAVSIQAVAYQRGAVEAAAWPCARALRLPDCCSVSSKYADASPSVMRLTAA